MLGVANGLIWQGTNNSASIIAGANQGTAIKLNGEWQGSGFDTTWVGFGDCLNLGTNDFSISCWFKRESWTPTRDTNEAGEPAGSYPPGYNIENKDQVIFSKNGYNTITEEHSGVIKLYLQTGRLKFIVHDGSSYIINSKTAETDLTDFLAGTGPIVQTFNHDIIPIDTWNHFCVSVDRSGNCVMYLNGSPFENFSTIDISGDSSVNFDNKGHWKIGTHDGIGALPFSGNVSGTFFDEYGIWNSALDADNVAAIYNSGNPINLLVNSGNYDESSALQAYWKFGDGEGDIKYPETAIAAVYIIPDGGGYATNLDYEYTHDGETFRRWNYAIINPIIRDQKNNGFGSELWDAIQPSTGSWTVYDNNTVEVDSGAVKITCVDNENGARALFSNATNLSTDLSAGGFNTYDSARHWYKLSLKAKVNSGASVHIFNAINTTDEEITSVEKRRRNRTINPITSTEFVEINIYFEGIHATDQYLAFESMSSGNIIWIKDISLKKLNGHNGTTDYTNYLTPGVSPPNSGGDSYAEFVSDAPPPHQT